MTITGRARNIGVELCLIVGGFGLSRPGGNLGLLVQAPFVHHGVAPPLYKVEGGRRVMVQKL